MGQPADKDVDDGHEQPPQAAGKVEHDARGKAVWRWAADVLENTSVLLKRLENRALALEPTQKVRALGGTHAASKKPGSRDTDDDDLSLEQAADSRDTGGGFDPYNSR